MIFSFVWGLLHIQSCEIDSDKQLTCEQLAENNSKNCKYLILKWKKVNYDQELQASRKYEIKNGKAE